MITNTNTFNGSTVINRFTSSTGFPSSPSGLTDGSNFWNTYFNNILESNNTDIAKANYKRFYFDVKLIREKLIDENLIIQINVMLNKVEDYNRKIKIFKIFNNELIVLLSKKDIH